MKPSRAGVYVDFKHRQVLPRFRDASLGVWQAYREEPNLRFHLFAASLVAVGAWAIRPLAWEIAYLALTVTAVLTAEMVNTAVERTVDLAAGGQRHPLAARAKEVAAGAVLLAALHALFAAVFIFGVQHSVRESLMALISLLQAKPWAALIPLLLGYLGMTVKEPPSHRW